MREREEELQVLKNERKQLKNTNLGQNPSTNVALILYFSIEKLYRRYGVYGTFKYGKSVDKCGKAKGG